MKNRQKFTMTSNFKNRQNEEQKNCCTHMYFKNRHKVISQQAINCIFCAIVFEVKVDTYMEFSPKYTLGFA